MRERHRPDVHKTETRPKGKSKRLIKLVKGKVLAAEHLFFVHFLEEISGNFLGKYLGKCEKLPLSHAPHSFLTKQKLAIRPPECYTIRV